MADRNGCHGKYILSIDQGTTSSRAIIFAEDGQVVHVKGYPFEQKYPNPGWCEQDPYDILQSTIRSINEVSELIAPYGGITAVGITNQRETVIAWDKVTGKPLYNAIVWLDLRTYDTVKALTMDGSKDRFRPITGLPISTYFTALKIRWLLDNVNDVSDAVKEGRCLFGKEMLMDLEKLGWCEDICNELGIPIDTLPTIVPSCGHIGTITNSESESRDHQLHPSLFNVPITAILGDQQSALLGHGCVKVGQAKCTYGTGCFMLANTGDKIIQSSFGLLTTVAFKREGGPVYYALEGSVAIAGRAVQWLRDQLG
ncbi:hypothetical protein FOZ62_006768, partial [Perkinsus olseni]